jgi:protein O-GlcNAc transferase
MPQITIEQAFDLALRQHRAGRLREAENLYRQILAQRPAHVEALHFLGVIAHQMGRNDIAVDLIRRAIALRPCRNWQPDPKKTMCASPANWPTIFRV